MAALESIAICPSTEWESRNSRWKYILLLATSKNVSWPPLFVWAEEVIRIFSGHQKMTAGVSKGNSSTYEFCVDSALFLFEQRIVQNAIHAPYKKDHRPQASSRAPPKSEPPSLWDLCAFVCHKWSPVKREIRWNEVRLFLYSRMRNNSQFDVCILLTLTFILGIQQILDLHVRTSL